MKQQSIKVAVRVRPALPREIKNDQFINCVAVAQNQQDIYVSMDSKPVIINQNNEIKNNSDNGLVKYNFDKVYQNIDQQTFYDNVVSQSVSNVLQGINSTIFAYGQTGTGKTYTIFGDEKDPDNYENQGMIPKAVQQIFKQLENMQKESQNQQSNENIEEEKQNDQQFQQNNMNFEQDNTDDIDDNSTLIGEIEKTSQVFISVLQIYNENVNDLLGNNTSSEFLKIRKVGKVDDEQYYAQGLTQEQVFCYQDVMKLVKKAYQNRTSNSTQMNEVSSRSHLILTVTVNQFQSDLVMQTAKLNLVDLAGSEKVRDSQSQGTKLKEACHINKSLFHFSQVIKQIEKQQQTNQNQLVNYRDSKLTMLLADSIGGNCLTTMIACLSPSQDFCKESNSTLKFAMSCKHIQNIVHVNKFKNVIPSSTPVQKKKKKDVNNVKDVVWQNHDFTIKQNKNLNFNNQLLNIYQVDSTNNNNKFVVFIHGHDKYNNGLDFQHQFQAFNYLGYNIIAIDLPGFGKSDGETQSFRTRHILSPQGPGETVMSVIKQLNINSENIVLVGYDWGASIALRLGIKYGIQQFSHIIAFMPAYGESEEYKDELTRLNIPTLIQWVKQDQLHPYQKFKKFAQKIPNFTLDMIDIKLWQASMSKGMYSQFSNKIMTSIFNFVQYGTITAPKSIQNAFIGQKEQVKNTHNNNVTQIQQITFNESLQQNDVNKLINKPSLEQANEIILQLTNRDFLNDILAKDYENTQPISMCNNELLQKFQNSVNQIQLKDIYYTNKQEIDLCLQIIKDKIQQNMSQNQWEDKQNIMSDEQYNQQFLNDIEQIKISTKYGNLQALKATNENNNYTIVAMHGDGKYSSCMAWVQVVKKFCDSGFNFYSLSMPGYGESTGEQHSFRSQGIEIIGEVINKLNITQNLIIMGRSVGGRTSIQFANSKYASILKAVILGHPVVPSDGEVQNLSRFLTILSWAKDDGEWELMRGKANAGHPFFGPHGAVFVKNLSGCHLIAWEEKNYQRGPREYYETTFIEQTLKILKQKL